MARAIGTITDTLHQDAMPHRWRGRRCSNRGEKTVSRSNKTRRGRGSRTEARLSTARYHRQQGDLKKACGIYRRFLESKPEHLEAILELGELYVQMGHPKEACVLFTGVIEDRAERAELWLGLASAQQAAGAYSASIGSFQRLIERRPTSEDGCGRGAGTSWR